MPLSTIFQLYCGSQFYWLKKPEDPEKTTDQSQVIDKLWQKIQIPFYPNRFKHKEYTCTITCNKWSKIHISMLTIKNIFLKTNKMSFFIIFFTFCIIYSSSYVFCYFIKPYVHVYTDCTFLIEFIIDKNIT